MNYWLVKSEPNEYSWDQFKQDGRTYWWGIRSYAARNHLKNMKVGDLVLYYHSNIGKEIVGIAKVVKEYYQDPDTDDDRWVVVDIVPVKDLKKPLSLETIKGDSQLQDMKLVKISRLSVSPVTEKEFMKVLELGETKLD